MDRYVGAGAKVDVGGDRLACRRDESDSVGTGNRAPRVADPEEGSASVEAGYGEIAPKQKRLDDCYLRIIRADGEKLDFSRSGLTDRQDRNKRENANNPAKHSAQPISQPQTLPRPCRRYTE
jgi:hypothetical protein